MSINLLFHHYVLPIIFVSYFYTFILSLEHENLRKDRLENDEKMRGNTGDMVLTPCFLIKTTITESPAEIY